MDNSIDLKQILETASLDFKFDYKVLGKPFKNACQIRYFDRQPQVVVLTELKGHGMSVTNSVECIIPQLELFLLLNKAIVLRKDCVYIEHYDKNSYYEPNNDETFDRVMLLNGRPGWSRLSKDEVNVYLS